MKGVKDASRQVAVKRTADSHCVVRSVQLPFLNLGGAVPGDVDLTASVGVNGDRGKRRRGSGPVCSQRSVALDVSDTKLYAVDNFASAVVLGELGAGIEGAERSAGMAMKRVARGSVQNSHLPPPHHHVAVVLDLDIALTLRDSLVPWDVGERKVGGEGRDVNVDDESSRVVLVRLPGGSGVVEERDLGLAGVPPCIVLPLEACVERRSRELSGVSTARVQTSTTHRCHRPAQTRSSFLRASKGCPRSIRRRSRRHGSVVTRSLRGQRKKTR